MFFYKRKKAAIGLVFCAVMFACAAINADILTCKKDLATVNRPLRILFAVGTFPAPSQTFILNIITGLIDKGHDVSIFSFRKGAKNEIVHPNIVKYKLMDRVIYQKLPAQLPDYDIVFCQFGYIGEKIAKMKNVRSWLEKRKFVVCFRGADLTKFVQNKPTIYTSMFKKVDLVLPVCAYFTPRLVSLGCNKDKIVVHHSAIDCSRFSFSVKNQQSEGDVIKLISVCRLVEKKGIDYAIKAIAEVVKKYPNIHYTVVGDGPEKCSLEKLIVQLGLQDKVTLHGWESQEKVVSLLQQSHIFMLPSRTGSDGNEEGIANALKEAMAVGLISIGTLHAGTPELIENDKTGFLVAEKDVNQLAKIIEYVIAHPEKWASIAVAARKKIEDEFETGKSIERLEEIFYQLLEFGVTSKMLLNHKES